MGKACLCADKGLERAEKVDKLAIEVGLVDGRLGCFVTTAEGTASVKCWSRVRTSRFHAYGSQRAVENRCNGFAEGAATEVDIITTATPIAADWRYWRPSGCL